MATRTYLILGDIEGKLDLLCVECTKCARKKRNSVAISSSANLVRVFI